MRTGSDGLTLRWDPQWRWLKEEKVEDTVNSNISKTAVLTHWRSLNVHLSLINCGKGVGCQINTEAVKLEMDKQLGEKKMINEDGHAKNLTFIT